MKNRLLYENLDTSFVNLAALVRFLRARRFAGSVRVELGDYEGEIFLTADDDVRARERDYVSGRVAEGDEALRRLLIRAREPNGTINVYRATDENAIAFKNEKTAGAGLTPSGNDETFSLDIPDANSARVKIFQQPLSLPETKGIAENQINVSQKALIIARDETVSEVKPKSKSLEFPFELSNKVESKARQHQLPETEWQELLQLTAELLRTIDDTLAKSNLNFAAAFQKACVEASSDYPFLNPNAGIFAYRNGKADMREQVNAKLFTAAINETLRRILEKLAANPKFAEAHRDAAQNILALVRKNKPRYDEFFITPQLEKILGI